jgi:hypothetical protein
MRPQTRTALEKLAANSGRTLGGEVEVAIERALATAGNKSATFAIMLLISDTIDGLVALHPGSKAFKGEPGGWLRDAYLHEQAKLVVTTMFDLFRPLPGDWQPQPGSPEARQGAIFVGTRMIELQTAKISNPQTAHERWLAFVRSNIGDFLDRPVVGGIPAAHRREVLARGKPAFHPAKPATAKRGPRR